MWKPAKSKNPPRQVRILASSLFLKLPDAHVSGSKVVKIRFRVILIIKIQNFLANPFRIM
jgi:hypothetical protein